MATVTPKFTGNVHARMGACQVDFSFERTRLRELLNAVFAQHNMRDLLQDESGNLKPCARVLVKGRFSDLLQGLDTPLREEDTVVVTHPYAVAF